MRRFLSSLLVALFAGASGCSSAVHTHHGSNGRDVIPCVVVLGIAQDAGYPQAACRKPCCEPAWADVSKRRHVTCLAIVDPKSGERWMIDATPDFKVQLHRLDQIAPPRDSGNVSQPALDGILLTHAHIGHYTGLQNLGREVTGASAVPVYAMPRLRKFLETSGPWSLLVSAGHIELHDLIDAAPVALNDHLTVTPLLVPHRDEYSETVGFRISSQERSVLFIPDIDKWEQWSGSIEEELRKVDVAYLDGTFFRNGEIPGRDMSQIPHPFIEETMNRLARLDPTERAKVRFIHFNHTNPVLFDDAVRAAVVEAGFGVAVEGERVVLGGGAPSDEVRVIHE